ncbi:MAG: NAD(P)H-dependent oxidoreductase subunit E [Dehalococcoidia bacterium]|nr:NAD(P)H-dependent oxidoreductase subunit E [Dehalococcoidia bacterium]
MGVSNKEKTDNLLSLLRNVQEEYGYLPEDRLREIAATLDKPLIDVYSVATFYKSFSLTPRGRHHFKVCLGTACHVRGSNRILEETKRKLGIQPGETSENGEFSLETVMCLGCCAIGPVIVVDNKYYGQMTPAKLEAVLKTLGRKECLSEMK